MKKVGFTWLQERLDIKGFRLTHESYEDVPEELLFLQCYDELKGDIQGIVDMPDNKVDRMILLLHQNKGKLASRRRKFYQELSNNEIEQMEQAYILVFKSKKND